MPPGLGFGLLSALCWGLVDLTAATAGRRTGSLRAIVVTQCASLAALGIFILLQPNRLGPSASAGILMALPLGLGSAAAYICYFTALRLGPLSVVSPIIVAYGGLTVILAVVIRGESMQPLQVAGAVCATLGVILTGLVFHGGKLRGARLVGPGVVAAVITALLFASVSILLASPIREHGWLATVTGSRLANTAASICLLLLVTRSRSPRLQPLLRSVSTSAIPRWVFAVLIAAGVCDIGGFLVYAIGMDIGPVWLVGLASSFGPVMVIAYGVGRLGERLAPTQWAGLALLGAGIVVLAVAG
jgi:drug/metabolite transporter (DMT)-like permease